MAWRARYPATPKSIWGNSAHRPMAQELGMGQSSLPPRGRPHGAEVRRRRRDPPPGPVDSRRLRADQPGPQRGRPRRERHRRRSVSTHGRRDPPCHSASTIGVRRGALLSGPLFGGPGQDQAEVAHRSTTICHLSDIAVRLRRKLRWDTDCEQFPNDDEANRMLGGAMRSPWRL